MNGTIALCAGVVVLMVVVMIVYDIWRSKKGE